MLPASQMCILCGLYHCTLFFICRQPIQPPVQPRTLSQFLGSTVPRYKKLISWADAKLILPPKFPRLTPRLDPPEVGTRQLTLCPSSTNSLEPSPNLVPSEVPASGQHGFVKWGHDAKITKIGVIATRGSPGQGKANGSQVRRQDLGLLSGSLCLTYHEQYICGRLSLAL